MCSFSSSCCDEYKRRDISSGFLISLCMYIIKGLLVQEVSKLQHQNSDYHYLSEFSKIGFQIGHLGVKEHQRLTNSCLHRDEPFPWRL